MKNPLLYLGLVVAVLSVRADPPDLVVWEGGDGLDWGTSGNWVGGSPEGSRVLFGDDGMSEASTVTNRVGSNVTIASLAYRNLATVGVPLPTDMVFHVTEILEGVTLTVGDPLGPYSYLGGDYPGVLVVGNHMTDSSSAPFSTTAILRGEGSLVVDQSNGNIFLANTNSGTGYNSFATLDMSGLAHFQATIDTLVIGVTGFNEDGTNNTANRMTATVYLAESNEITADLIRLGQSRQTSSQQTRSYLYLGTENVINVDRFEISSTQPGRSNDAVVAFQDDLDSATLVLRGKAGGSSRVADVIIGFNGSESGTNLFGVGHWDLSGGSVDARIENLVIGSAFRKRTNDAVSAIGTLTMVSGSMDVLDFVLGEVRPRNGTLRDFEGSAQAELYLSGGSIVTESLGIALNDAGTANPRIGTESLLEISGTGYFEVLNDIVFGSLSGPAAGAVTDSKTNALIDLQSGTLRVGGNIVQGTNWGEDNLRTRLRVAGGTLEMTGGSVASKEMDLESGVLRDVGAIVLSEVTDQLEKTTGGTLILEGSNAFGRSLLVSEGMLRVDGTLSGTPLTIAGGAILSGVGSVASGSVLLESGAFLSPGNSPGTLTFGDGLDLTEIAGTGLGSLIFDLGTASDQVVVSGGVLALGEGLLGWNDFDFVTGSGFGVGEYVLFSTVGISGSLGGLNSGSFGDDLTGVLAFSGDDLVLTVVPEPALAVLLLAGVMLFVRMRGGRLSQRR